MKFPFLLLIVLLATYPVYAQKQVAITIDDIPNTKNEGVSVQFLKELDNLQIPIAIFINENRIYHSDTIIGNYALLNEWAKRTYVTLGNHSYSHLRYSKVGYEEFSRDVIKGEVITNELAKKYHKELQYFRFPYNDLGKDSIQSDSIKTFLKKNHYTITPFTIESADWLFNELYIHYLNKNLTEDAKRVANAYIEYTVSLFKHFENSSLSNYGRHIKHIYLCHDNLLNAHYLKELITKLKDQGYSFISLDNAMRDNIYNATNYYHGKWGFSWIYRWMKDKSERSRLMRSEPSMMDIYEEHQKIMTKK
ncbi:polysaccharide deacetylase family protein [Leptobacterium sp. I13]|uniref:polysaccharide deacetylase family protein n=1 Tax=Leptobacterium meishanense TaxID=3128904 RepID=UPI0030ED8E7E